MSDKLQALKDCLLFSYINRESVAKISRVTCLQHFQKNETIFHEGDPALGFYIVAAGSVKVYKLSLSGNEHILHVVGKGGSFAEAVVFGRLKVYPAFAEALTEAEVLFVPRQEFLELMKSDFSLTLCVLSSIAEKLRHFNALVEELSLKEADARLAKYLLDLSFRKGHDVFSLDIKKVELAKKLGIVPETLSRVFKKLSKKHVLRLDRDQISLLDKERLQAISSGAH